MRQTAPCHSIRLQDKRLVSSTTIPAVPLNYRATDWQMLDSVDVFSIFSSKKCGLVLYPHLAAQF
jgi:hypothetical protein